MLRIQLKEDNVTNEDKIEEEFSIITNDVEKADPIELELEQTDKVKLETEVKLDFKPKSAWEDESDDLNTSDSKYIPTVLRSKRKTQGEEEYSDDDENIISNVKVLRKSRSSYLPNDKLLFKNLGFANSERKARSPISATEFNPKYQLLMVTSHDTSLALFDMGEKNVKFLKDRVFEKFPISCAKFTVDGERVVLTPVGYHSFRIYDVNSSMELRASQFQVNRKLELSKIAINPLGNTFAIGTTVGNVFITDAMEKISTLTCPGRVVDLSYSSNGHSLFVSSNTGDIIIYDLRNSAKGVIQHRWTDFGNSTLSTSVSKDSKWIACGTDSGFVNLYSFANILKTYKPEPFKSLDNLRTPVNLSLFSPRNEVLAFASSDTATSLRIYHIEGGYVFQNVFNHLNGLIYPTTLGFSTNGRYLCVGQKSGLASLFCLQHYEQY